MPYSTSTPALSTSSSSRGLTLTMGYLILRGASRLDAFSVYPVPTWLPGRGVDRQPVHQRSVHPGPLVLRTAPLRYPTPTPDRDRTVSRRSEPSSRTALMGEQPNPWDLLQPQDAMSRHRGAKPLRRCFPLHRQPEVLRSLLQGQDQPHHARRKYGRRAQESDLYPRTGIRPRVHIDGVVWHLDVGSSHPGAVVGPKGWAVRPLKQIGRAHV